MLVLAVLWWSWSGYAWLTSLVDPEEGVVRIAMFGAMAAFLVAALCVPEAFGDSALIFALAYAGVRIAHIVLFVIGSRDDPNLRSSVISLAVSTAIGVGLLVAASFTDGTLSGVLWGVAILLDYGGPYFFGVEGWRMMPSHFAERFGLIVIIALGESIVAIGVGVESEVDAGIVVAAVLGVIVAGALWWLYFDVVALVAERRLSKAAPGRERNSIGRDSYGYLHFPMVAGIVLLALGLKKTLGHVEEPLKLVPAVALLGGTAMYLVRARRVPPAQRAPLQRRAAGVRARAARADPGRDRARGAGDARHPRRAAGRADRLREHPLRRAPRSPAPPGGPRLMSLSVCLIASAPAARVAALLEPVRELADEIVIAADSRGDAATLAGYAALADRCFRLEYRFYERHLGWLHEQCSGDWILRLDDDEVLSAAFVARLPALLAARDVRQYWMRAGVAVPGRGQRARRRAVVARLQQPPRPQRRDAALPRPPALGRRPGRAVRVPWRSRSTTSSCCSPGLTRGATRRSATRSATRS